LIQLFETGIIIYAIKHLINKIKFNLKRSLYFQIKYVERILILHVPCANTIVIITYFFFFNAFAFYPYNIHI